MVIVGVRGGLSFERIGRFVGRMGRGGLGVVMGNKYSCFLRFMEYWEKKIVIFWEGCWGRCLNVGDKEFGVRERLGGERLESGDFWEGRIEEL